MHAKLVEKFEPFGRGCLRHLAGNTEAAVPAIERRKVTIGFKVRTLSITAFKKLAQLGVCLHHMAISVDNRIVHVHGPISCQLITPTRDARADYRRKATSARGSEDSRKRENFRQ